MKELEDKSYMFTENTLMTEETGLKSTRFVFDLQKLGQAILYKLKQHEENIQDLYQRDAEKDKKIVSMEREIEQLKRQLR
jgi:predicted RNase H-like nuclease (RuvC/YqgF family)